MPTITLPNTITIESHEASKPMVEISIQEWSPEFVMYMLKYAWKIRMDRCTSSAKDHAAARLNMFNGMKAGELPTKGGGGTRPVSEEAKEAAYLHKFLIASKIKGKADDLDARLLQLALNINAKKPLLTRETPEQVAAGMDAFRQECINSPAYKAIVLIANMGNLTLGE